MLNAHVSTFVKVGQDVGGEYRVTRVALVLEFIHLRRCGAKENSFALRLFKNLVPQRVRCAGRWQFSDAWCEDACPLGF